MPNAVIISDREEGAQVYVREARRVRAELRNQPGLMHRALGEISGRNDLTLLPQGRRLSRPDQFAASVAAKLEGRILRYSARLELLQEADGLGIERFEANLIIAAAQHRAVNNPAVATGGAIAGSCPGSRHAARSVLAAGIIQSVLLLGMWWMLH